MSSVLTSNLSTREPLFKEKQRFTQWWLWLILLLPFIMMLYGFWQQMQSSEPYAWRSILMGNGVVLIVILLFFLMRLDTEIREDGVYVRFFPFALKMRRYGWADIDKAYVRSYLPLMEYGGWGIRYGLKGKALNVSGKKGLQLELKNGKRLLIGTKRPEELEQALAQVSMAL